MSKLSEFWISKASAAQRTGRAGRTGPGECFRLYSENEYNHMNEFAVPEIQRAPLEPIVLDIKALGLGDPAQFEFIEVTTLTYVVDFGHRWALTHLNQSPSPIALEASINMLKALDALDGDEAITSLGQVLADLPIDAVLGKMLIMSSVCSRA
jgi:ATP-dependent RNA helicase DHX34